MPLTSVRPLPSFLGSFVLPPLEDPSDTESTTWTVLSQSPLARSTPMPSVNLSPRATGGPIDPFDTVDEPEFSEFSVSWTPIPQHLDLEQ